MTAPRAVCQTTTHDSTYTALHGKDNIAYSLPSLTSSALTVQDTPTNRPWEQDSKTIHHPTFSTRLPVDSLPHPAPLPAASPLTFAFRQACTA